MAHELHRLTSSIVNEPLFVTEDKLREINAFLGDRNNGLIKMALESNKKAFNQDDLRVENGVGVISLQGPTTSKPSLYSAICGSGVDYQTVLQQMNALVARDDVKTILLDVDGPGGHALNMCWTSKEMRRLADTNGKRIVAYVDGMAASATLGLTTAAHEVIANLDSQLGSCGVVVALQNDNEAQKKSGVKTQYVTAGASKVPFDADGEFRDGYLADLQERVDEMYESFTGLVAEQRNIPQEVVKGTEAKMFSANKAVELGLADKVMNPTEFYEYLATITEQTNADASSATTTVSNKSNANLIETKRQEETSMSDDVTVPEASAELQAQLATQSAQMAEMLEAMNTMKAEKAELAATLQAQKDAEAKAEVEASLEAVSFLTGDVKASAVSFLMGADEAGKELLMGVITSAQSTLSTVTAEAAEQVVTAQAATDEAVAAKEAIKEEFATTSESLPATELKESSIAGQSVLAERIAARKAELNTK